RAQLAALDRAIDIVAGGSGAAIVTAPTSKEAITLSGCAFTGQTEHLAARTGLERDAVTMMFLGPRLRVGLVTTHLSVREATDAITQKRVRRSVLHLAEAVERMLGRPGTLVVSGLNPHAGESGLFGDEEQVTITPALESLRLENPELGHRVHGPMPAESALRYAADGRYDCVLTMIHDQATIASKLLDWGRAVNVTWGLPFLRTSVDHGTAYDAAKSGSADPEGMCSALRMASRLCQKG
ncbi:MAG: 4-hydroxy-L-threonine phosphate dehydrogenase PdxA, partial [Myxococcota bacterium]